MWHNGESLRLKIFFFSLLQLKDDTRSKSIKSTASRKQEAKALNKIESKSKLKSQIKKAVKQSPKPKASDESQKEAESEKEAKKKPKLKKTASSLKSTSKSNKRKKTKDDDKSGDKNVVVKKRMASLNASAILAANYEIENYAAKHESSSTETSDSSGEERDDDDDVEEKKPPTMKKEKKDVKMESEEVFLLLFCLLFTFSSPQMLQVFQFLQSSHLWDFPKVFVFFSVTNKQTTTTTQVGDNCWFQTTFCYHGSML